ncbi:hypothetical protein [Bradyrhizobium sp. CCBAU 25338]|uniref:hypothetical protein n=1 Tax=Bradyrhizobium sp. CCBAU 25338 TaxID=1641877 RepID=UPI00230318F2|nr:hypothetical protein [Bradyrhizobium sp. CCBAU 25338]
MLSAAKPIAAIENPFIVSSPLLVYSSVETSSYAGWRAQVLRTSKSLGASGLQARTKMATLKGDRYAW